MLITADNFSIKNTNFKNSEFLEKPIVIKITSSVDFSRSGTAVYITLLMIVLKFQPYQVSTQVSFSTVPLG